MFLLTFPAFCLGLVNSFALFLASCGPRSYHFSDFSCTARRQPNEVVSESADIPLENFPTYEDCTESATLSVDLSDCSLSCGACPFYNYAIVTFRRQSLRRRDAGPFSTTQVESENVSN